MEKNEVQKMIMLRKFVIEAFNSLEGKNDSLSMTKQQDTAYTLSSVIKSLDELLSDYVKFD
jgi:hypothetical protein|tara:strand:- start:8768 stop:8950 length:183 start_codon:yes stop_codon:yes gene_type:complete